MRLLPQLFFVLLSWRAECRWRDVIRVSFLGLSVYNHNLYLLRHHRWSVLFPNAAAASSPDCVNEIPPLELSALQSLYNSTDGVHWSWLPDYSANGIPWNFTGCASNANISAVFAEIAAGEMGLINSDAFPGYCSCPCADNWQGVTCIAEPASTKENEFETSNIGSLTLEVETDPTFSCALLNYYLSTLFPLFSVYYCIDLQLLIFYANGQAFNLSGTLPADIYSLTKLFSFELTDNPLLTGSIPWPPTSQSVEVWQLLETLQLYGCSLTGSLPEELFSSLTVVSVLNLSSNKLTGKIPSTIGDKMLLLREFSLFSNSLTGSIPSNLFSSLRYLNDLFLDVNLLTGSIPGDAFIGGDILSGGFQLLYLSLGFNSLTGGIPQEIGKLSNLLYLDIGMNFFTGTTIPPELGLCNKIFALFLQSLQLIGPIPEELGNLTQLSEIYMNNNTLTGPLPATFSDMTGLATLYVAFNKLTGTIPGSFGGLSALQGLFLQGNYFSGRFPAAIFTGCPQLIQLVLQQNLFTGSLPSQVGQLQALEALVIDENYFSSAIPSTIGNLSSLSFLGLHLNCFSGKIPVELAELANSLVILYLNDNLLSGTIPSLLVQMLTKISYMNLSSNYLSGTIPSSIQNLKLMQELDLSSNLLHGMIKDGTFSTLPVLNVLFIQKNSLSGSLDLLVNSSLQRNISNIDLSNNQFTGQIPLEPFLIPSLRTFAAIQNCIFGDITDSICTSLDIAAAQVDRSIEPGGGIQSLMLDGLSTATDCQQAFFPSLSQYFPGLSPNPTNGDTKSVSYQVRRAPSKIPSCLFEIPSLQTLHLSGNLLSGSIPSNVTMGALLKDLSLSHNILVGPIPATVQSHDWNNLDLAFNRINGVLQDIGVFETTTKTTTATTAITTSASVLKHIAAPALVVASLVASTVAWTVTAAMSAVGLVSVDMKTHTHTHTHVRDRTVSAASTATTIMYENAFIVPNSSLALQVNRLSGRIPQSVYGASQLEILNGNLFSCGYADISGTAGESSSSLSLSSSSLPAADPSSATYTCASDSLDFSMFVWLGLAIPTLMALIALYLIGSDKLWGKGKDKGREEGKVVMGAAMSHTVGATQIYTRSVVHSDPPHIAESQIQTQKQGQPQKRTRSDETEGLFSVIWAQERLQRIVDVQRQRSLLLRSWWNATLPAAPVPRAPAAGSPSLQGQHENSARDSLPFAGSGSEEERMCTADTNTDTQKWGKNEQVRIDSKGAGLLDERVNRSSSYLSLASYSLSNVTFDLHSLRMGRRCKDGEGKWPPVIEESSQSRDSINIGNKNDIPSTFRSKSSTRNVTLHELTANITNFAAVMHRVRSSCIKSTIVLVCLLMPSYAILSIFYRTYEYEYAWVVAACYLSGVAPALVLQALFSLFLVAIMHWFTGWKGKRGRNKDKNKDKNECVKEDGNDPKTQDLGLSFGVADITNRRDSSSGDSQSRSRQRADTNDTLRDSHVSIQSVVSTSSQWTLRALDTVSQFLSDIAVGTVDADDESESIIKASANRKSVAAKTTNEAERDHRESRGYRYAASASVGDVRTVDYIDCNALESGRINQREAKADKVDFADDNTVGRSKTKTSTTTSFAATTTGGSERFVRDQKISTTLSAPSIRLANEPSTAAAAVADAEASNSIISNNTKRISDIAPRDSNQDQQHRPNRLPSWHSRRTLSMRMSYVSISGAVRDAFRKHRESRTSQFEVKRYSLAAALCLFNFIVVMTANSLYVSATLNLGKIEVELVAVILSLFKIVWNNVVVAFLIRRWNEVSFAHPTDVTPAAEGGAVDDGDAGFGSCVPNSDQTNNPLHRSIDTTAERSVAAYDSTLEMPVGRMGTPRTVQQAQITHPEVQAAFATARDSTIFLRMTLVLFNTIIAPCLATAVVSPDCFYYVAVPPPLVSVTYTFNGCAFFTTSVDDCVPAISSHTASYQPPFNYNFECSAALLTRYASVFVYSFLITGFLLPLSWILVKVLHQRMERRREAIRSSPPDTTFISSLRSAPASAAAGGGSNFPEPVASPQSVSFWKRCEQLYGDCLDAALPALLTPLLHDNSISNSRSLKFFDKHREINPKDSESVEKMGHVGTGSEDNWSLEDGTSRGSSIQMQALRPSFATSGDGSAGCSHFSASLANGGAARAIAGQPVAATQPMESAASAEQQAIRTSTLSPIPAPPLTLLPAAQRAPPPETTTTRSGIVGTDRRIQPRFFWRENYIVKLLNEVAILVTFGAVFPPLAVVICTAICCHTCFIQLLMGRIAFVARRRVELRWARRRVERKRRWKEERNRGVEETVPKSSLSLKEGDGTEQKLKSSSPFLGSSEGVKMRVQVEGVRDSSRFAKSMLNHGVEKRTTERSGSNFEEQKTENVENEEYMDATRDGDVGEGQKGDVESEEERKEEEDDEDAEEEDQDYLVLGILAAVNKECDLRLVPLSPAVMPLSLLTALFYALFLFDVLGDAVGSIDALWILFTMAAKPIAILAVAKLIVMVRRRSS